MVGLGGLGIALDYNPPDKINNDELQNIDNFLSQNDIENQDEDILESQIYETNDNFIHENDKIILAEEDLNKSWDYEEEEEDDQIVQEQVTNIINESDDFEFSHIQGYKWD